MIESEEKDENYKHHNVELLRTLSAFLIKAPPVLTLQLELGNLRRSSKNDFVYSDYSTFMGKTIFLTIIIHIYLSCNRFAFQR